MHRVAKLCVTLVSSVTNVSLAAFADSADGNTGARRDLHMVKVRAPLSGDLMAMMKNGDHRSCHRSSSSSLYPCTPCFAPRASIHVFVATSVTAPGTYVASPPPENPAACRCPAKLLRTPSIPL